MGRDFRREDRGKTDCGAGRVRGYLERSRVWEWGAVLGIIAPPNANWNVSLCMKPRLPIYMDYNATTPVDGRVFEAMRPYFTEVFGNAASSSHGFGRTAMSAVVNARNQVAALLNVEQDSKHGAREIVWTSGATESNNLAIKGVAQSYSARGKHIITQATEHKAVLDTCQRLAS